MMSQENPCCQPDFLPKSRPAPVPQWTISLRDNRKQVRVLKEDIEVNNLVFVFGHRPVSVSIDHIANCVSGEGHAVGVIVSPHTGEGRQMHLIDIGGIVG
jgi:hypothetical protein